MARIVVVNWVTLDGVMQGPGRADEDTRDGFADGGWAEQYNDPVINSKLGAVMGGEHAWLFGRTTYEGLLSSWNQQGGPFKDALNDTQKYVASANRQAALDWPRSTLLCGDVPDAVRRLKSRSDVDLIVMGSGVLVSSLVGADLIDSYVLMIAPIVLGRGRRLFAEGLRTSLRLVESTATSSGAMVARYDRDR
jgi:dihydrofolate reductase